MTNEEKLTKIFLKDKINFLLNSTGDLTESITNVLYQTAIIENKKVLMILDNENINNYFEDAEYYTASLVSLLTGEDIYTCLAYINPFNYKLLIQQDRKNIKNLKNKEKYIDTLEKIKNSDLNIVSQPLWVSGKVPFIFDDNVIYEDYDLVIFKDFNLLYDESLFKNKKYKNKEEETKVLLKYLINYSKKHKTKFLCCGNEIINKSEIQFLENSNIIHVSYFKNENNFILKLSNGDLIKFDKTNKIIEYKNTI